MEPPRNRCKIGQEATRRILRKTEMWKKTHFGADLVGVRGSERRKHKNIDIRRLKGRRRSSYFSKKNGTITKDGNPPGPSCPISSS